MLELCHVEHLLHVILGKVKHLIAVLLSWVMSGTNRKPFLCPVTAAWILAVNASQVLNHGS